tara:strand:- start:105 stop:1358 length:1254 start_codon:yes stop_codon:yes gene_type:complete
MNIIEQQDKLKSAPDDSLAREMKSPSGMFPQYLVMTEIQRREKMRTDYEGKQAADSKASPRLSMAEEMAMSAPQPQQNSAGIAGLLEQPQQPMQPQQPQMQQEPVKMAAGQEVPFSYSPNNPFASAFPVDDPLTEEDESESKYMKAMREYYEERNRLMPEKLEKERKFRGGLDLIKTGLAVGTSATSADLNKNLSGAIDSISKTSSDLRKAEDSMSKSQLEFAKSKAIDEARTQDLRGKAAKFEQDDFKAETARMDTEKRGKYYEGLISAQNKDPKLIQLAESLVERDTNQTLPIYDLVNTGGKETKVINQDLLNQYASSLASSPTSQNIRQTGATQMSFMDSVTETMNSVPVMSRIAALAKRLKISEEEARAQVQKQVMQERISLQEQASALGYKEGGVISNSVNSFNNVMKNING